MRRARSRQSQSASFDKGGSTASGGRGIHITVVLVSVMTVLVVIAVGVVIAAGYQVGRVNTAELLRDKAVLVIDSIIERTRSHLAPAEAELRFLAGLIATGRVDIEDDRDVANMLLASLAAAPQVSVVAYLTPDLKILRAFRNRPDRPIQIGDWSDVPYFVELMADLEAGEGGTWGELFVAEETGERFINVRVPLEREGRFAGALLAGVSITDLSRFLAGLKGDFADNVFILHGRDYVLAHPALMGRDARAGDTESLLRLEDFPDRILARLWTADRNREVEQNFTATERVRAVVVDGETYVFLLSEIDMFGPEPWTVGAYARFADAAGQLERVGRFARFGLITVVLAVALAFLIGRGLARPIRHFADAAHKIRGLDLADVPILKTGSFREMNEAVAAFNDMMGSLRLFATYVPRALVSRLMRQAAHGAIESEERDVTVLFTDISGFTGLAQDMPARQLADFLNAHFAKVLGCVHAEQGTLDKYIGDAAMAFWGAPERQGDHAERACRAALAIAREIKADNAERRAAGLSPIRLRIGVHSGPVVVGNIGAPGRVNYTIIGDAVNIAERLEEMSRALLPDTEEVGVIVSGETANRLGGAFRLEGLGRHAPRGRRDAVEVYRLVEGEPDP